MPTINDFQHWLTDFAPLRLAADWDNVGLLIGDPSRNVERAMTCLTVTGATVAEAIEQRAQLIITHHPFPFHATKRITAETHNGRLLLSLIEAQIAVISPHTAFDSAAQGINQQLADLLSLQQVAPLTPDTHDSRIGTGRIGKPKEPLSLHETATKLAKALNIKHWQYVGLADYVPEKIAIACGAAGELLTDAIRAGADCFVTGEVRFHTALEAEAAGVALLLLGHYPSEHFAVERLASLLQTDFANCQIWASRTEADPVQTGCLN
jgi:dinuclear metal center YbgI/SA1388 family protein